MEGIIQSWGRILTGYSPSLSIEITRECPLRCPGCYAYGDAHLGGDVTLHGLTDYKGDELVDRFMEAGAVPIALIEWELTGSDAELRKVVGRATTVR